MNSHNSVVKNLINAVLSGEISDAREFSIRVQSLPAFSEESSIADALDQARNLIANGKASEDPTLETLKTTALRKFLDQL